MSDSSLVRLLVASVASVSIFFSPGFAEARSSKKLKRAAVECDVAAFGTHMSAADAAYVRETQAFQERLAGDLDDLAVLAQMKLGRPVERTERGLKFSINPEDERWSQIFGPSWSAPVGPQGDRHFQVQPWAAWTGECRDIVRFEACLSDRSFCREGSESEDSVLWLMKGSSKRDPWRLALKPMSDLKKKRRQAMEEVLARTVELLRDYFDGPMAESYDDAVYQMAVVYLTWMRQAMVELQRSFGAPGTSL